MGTVYQRGGVWWIVFKGPKRREFKSTGLSIKEPREKAAKMLRQVEAAVSSSVHMQLGEPKTVEEFAKVWTQHRAAAGLWNAARDLRRLEIYVLPRLGHLKLTSVRPLHVRELVAELRGKMPPRTVLNTYGLIRRLFADALADELVDSSPCVLKRGDLPRKADKVVGWREQAIYTRDEAELMLRDERIPLDRRVTYALGFLAGLRAGEVSALRWRHIDQGTPLGRISVVSSFTRAWNVEKAPKTGRAREVPVHPVLARLLASWRAGWVLAFGREPTPDDLVAPNHHGNYRTDNNFFKGISFDLELLGLRHRRFHDTRRTFISLARTDGANPAVLKTLTHDQVGDVFDQYTTFTWDAKCEAVAALKIQGRAKLLKLRRSASGSVTASVTVDQNGGEPMEITGGFSMGRAGLEPAGNDFSGGQPQSFQVVEGSKSSRRGAEKPGNCNTVTDDVSAAAEQFRRDGNRARFAAALRVALAKLRGSK